MVLSRRHTTQLHLSTLHFKLECIGYWSYRADIRLSPCQTAAKVNGYLVSLSHCDICYLPAAQSELFISLYCLYLH
jgi:hypothetical protein